MYINSCGLSQFSLVYLGNTKNNETKKRNIYKPQAHKHHNRQVS